ncbi:MAG: pinensin family lanthipeptide [Acidobacteriota bacterium]|nr:pinensin family lanthipeptide [Acidobacteriota bacterium]
MKKKLNLDQLKITSFITADDIRAGRAALAVAGQELAPVAGETLDEDPCTFDTLRDCN